MSAEHIVILVGLCFAFPCRRFYPVMINLNLYWIFLLAAVPTILSPGPGVLMSLTNSMRFGLKSAQPGILGVSVGTLVVGFVSVTGLGVVIAASETLYDAVRLAGIGFLIYLGYKKFKAKPFAIRLAHLEKSHGAADVEKSGAGKLFLEGVLLQLTNPALIIFYLSLFPQCIDRSLSYWPQVTMLTVNYAVMVWLIHSTYGWLGAMAAESLLKPSAAVWVNRVAGAAYWLLGASFLLQMLE